MKKTLILALSLVCVCLSGFAQDALPRSKSVPGAKVYIISPAAGETVTSPVKVQFGLQGMGIAPAGIKFDKTGHHHLAVDLDQLPALNLPLPSTKHLLHFGGGQTETVLKLKPGKHTLQLIFADYLHIPHDKPLLSKKITITVAK